MSSGLMTLLKITFEIVTYMKTIQRRVVSLFLINISPSNIF